MSNETGETNGVAPEAVPIQQTDAINNNQQPTADGEESQTKDDNVLLSHIVPPSHILADGRFIQLPPPSALERSAFFERAVAVHDLISGDGEEKEKKISNKKKRTKDDDDDAGTTAANGKKKKKTADAPFVHPLAIASARLRAKGMDELSKAINLGGLIIGGEYFGLSNIVNQRLSTKDNSSDTATAAGGEKGKEGEDGDPSSTVTDTEVDESIILDQRLRSKYVLRRRQSQYNNASTVLSRHEKRLSSSISVMRILDTRLQTLRKRWRLVAPEHGTRTIGPVRPREVVAVDVEVYDRDAASTEQSSLGRIARRVPRFATLELDDDYNVSMDVTSLRKHLKDVVNGLKNLDDDAEDGNGTSDDVKMKNGEDAPKNKSTSASSSCAETCKTKAEPFAIADPTLGKIDPDFDPDKVPLLTLLFEIEKPSTGFVERATLSSSFVSSANKDGGGSSTDNSNGKQQRLHSDERVIEALQHSLFCASLFESMRAEIIPSSCTQSNGGVAQLSQQKQKSVAWLSSEMEESFLPPPSVMAGEDTGLIGDTRLLCVIHCHEGEVKVQLDDEYSLTVKLIEAGTAAAAGTDNSVNAGTTTMATIKRSDNFSTEKGRTSGSQSPPQLRTLCRALLLHSQSIYHEHCTKTRIENDAAALQEREAKPAVGFARTKKEVKVVSPHILQSCVGLGCKFIFEKKVRIVLKRLTRWLEEEMNCHDKITVDWLPLALFDSHSRFSILFREMYLDIGIDGDVLRVTSKYKAVAFGSELELEYFLKLEFQRVLAV